MYAKLHQIGSHSGIAVRQEYVLRGAGAVEPSVWLTIGPAYFSQFEQAAIPTL
jgi:hypothetical protein